MTSRTLIQRFKEMIKGAFTTAEQKDTGGLDYVVQVQSNFLNTSAAVYYPYGYYASTPVNSRGWMFNINAQQENQVIMPYDPSTRFTGLESGEVMVGNQVQGTYIKFLNNGNVEILANATAKVTCVDSEIICSGNSTVTCVDSTITCSGNSSINCVDSDIDCSGNSTLMCVDGDITASGNVDISASGTVDISGTPTIDLTATTTNVNGNLVVSGTITGSDISDGTRSMSGDRAIFNGHTHLENGAGNQTDATGTPQ
jgi:hypothetical protein